MQDELLREARLQTALLRAGFKDRLDALAKTVNADPVSAAIVSYLRDNGHTKSSALKDAVAKLVPQTTDASNRTILRRLADLENDGVVERAGQAINTEYCLTGLIS
jgi:DNA-binding HxlR family transcriptional regulator